MTSVDDYALYSKGKQIYKHYLIVVNWNQLKDKYILAAEYKLIGFFVI